MNMRKSVLSHMGLKYFLSPEDRSINIIKKIKIQILTKMNNKVNF